MFGVDRAREKNTVREARRQVGEISVLRMGVLTTIIIFSDSSRNLNKNHTNHDKNSESSEENQTFGNGRP